MHSRNVYEKPLIPDTITLQRLQFDGSLNKDFGEIPTLKTKNNIALLGTSLAYALKATKIYYYGVDLTDHGYYFDKLDKYRELFDKSRDQLKHLNILGLDHIHDNYFVLANQFALEKYQNIKTDFKTFEINDVLKTFAIYKRILNNDNVELFTLNKESLLNEIGFKCIQADI